jgi:hypothetical protein
LVELMLMGGADYVADGQAAVVGGDAVITTVATSHASSSGTTVPRPS